MQLRVQLNSQHAGTAVVCALELATEARGSSKCCDGITTLACDVLACMAASGCQGVFVQPQRLIDAQAIPALVAAMNTSRDEADVQMCAAHVVARVCAAGSAAASLLHAKGGITALEHAFTDYPARSDVVLATLGALRVLVGTLPGVDESVADFDDTLAAAKTALARLVRNGISADRDHLLDAVEDVVNAVLSRTSETPRSRAALFELGIAALATRDRQDFAQRLLNKVTHAKIPQCGGALVAVLSLSTEHLATSVTFASSLLGMFPTGKLIEVLTFVHTLEPGTRSRS